MFKKIKSEKRKMTDLLNAQEVLDIVLGEEDEINYVVNFHGLDSVEKLIGSFPAMAYDENVIETYFEEDIPLDKNRKNKEILAFCEKRKQDFADALEDFKSSDIYESFVKVQELYNHYEKLAKEYLNN